MNSATPHTSTYRQLMCENFDRRIHCKRVEFYRGLWMALFIAYLDEEVEFSGIVGGSDDLLWRKAASKSCNFVIFCLYQYIISMLGIRDILVRIRILRSIPLTNESRSGSGSNSGSDSFFIGTLRMQKNSYSFLRTSVFEIRCLVKL